MIHSAENRESLQNESRPGQTYLLKSFELQELDPKLNEGWVIETDLPRFLRKKKEMPLFPRQLPQEHKPSFEIQYHFEDGTVLKPGDLVLHPYLRKVPRDLWPISRGSTERLIRYAAAPENPSPEARDYECVMIGVIQRALRIQDDHGFGIGLSWNQNPAIDRQVLPLKKVTFETERGTDSFPQLKLVVHTKKQNAQIRLETDGVPYSVLIFRNFSLNLNHQSLEFHTLGPLFTDFYQLKDPTFANYPEGNDLSHSLMRVELTDHSKISHSIRSIVQKLSHHLKEIEYHPKQELIPETHTLCEIVLEDPHFRIGFRVQAEKEMLNAKNLPSFASDLTRGFEDGFGAFDLHLNKHLLSQKDQAILKNRGLYLFLLKETLSHSLLGKDSRNQKHENFDALFESCWKLIPRLFKLQNRTMVEICSTSVEQAIHSFLQKVANKVALDEIEIFTDEGAYKLQGILKKSFLFIHDLIDEIAKLSGGECYLKPRGEFLPSLKNTENFELGTIDTASLLPTENHDKTAKIPLSLWFRLRAERGFLVQLNGKSVELLDETNFKAEFQIQDSQKIDWFELHPTVFLNGQEINLDLGSKLLRDGVIEHQGKYYQLNLERLPQFQALQVFWQKLTTEAGAGRGKKSQLPKYFVLPRNQTLELLALRASGFPIQGNTEWKKICDFYDHLGDHEQSLEAPTTLVGELKSYQRTGFNWLNSLYRLKMGGILADEMGLGKTIQTLSFLESLRISNELGHALIVVPTSLVFNWVNEATRFTPKLTLFDYSSRRDDFELILKENKNVAIVISYGLLVERFALFENRGFNIAIFDEAQQLKNITSKRTDCARKLRARFKLGLTGTPLENHYGELYSLLDLAVPGALGKWDPFRKTYIKPDVPTRASIDFLKKKIKPLILRRTKSEILKELPPKTETTLKIPFEEEQKRIYRDIALSWNKKVQDSIQTAGENRSQIEMLTALLRLRQVCSDPAAVPDVKYTQEPPKISVLMEALREITDSGESALIFTQFLPTFERIKKSMTRDKINFFCIHGSLSAKDRKDVLQGFENFAGGAVFLSTLKTGGVGLNLTKASYVFHIEPWWNPAVEDQATDRTHRIGQTKPVTVYRYVMEESVEERIEKLKERKKSRFDLLFSPNDEVGEPEPVQSDRPALTREDFEYLIQS